MYKKSKTNKRVIFRNGSVFVTVNKRAYEKYGDFLVDKILSSLNLNGEFEMMSIIKDGDTLIYNNDIVANMSGEIEQPTIIEPIIEKIPIDVVVEEPIIEEPLIKDPMEEAPKKKKRKSQKKKK